MTLRAIHAEDDDSPGEAEVQHAANLTPQHCVQYANVRFRTEGPSGPTRARFDPLRYLFSNTAEK